MDSTKKSFISQLKLRTKKVALSSIELCSSFNYNKANDVIARQLIKCSSSVGANYRAACVARSQKEFFSKLSIVIEESDETLYWLELIDSLKINKSNIDLGGLYTEVEELLKIFHSARNTIFLKH